MNDTIAWILNFFVANGYAMVFCASFGLFGSVMLIFRGTGLDDNNPKLRKIREREGLPEPHPLDGVRQSLTLIRRIGAVFLTIFLGIALAAGIRGLSGSATTREYIFNHGVTTRAVVEDSGDTISFVAQDGKHYRVVNDFFSPSVYPQQDFVSLSDDDEIQIRYLAHHPQAYVIDSGSVEDPW